MLSFFILLLVVCALVSVIWSKEAGQKVFRYGMSFAGGLVIVGILFVGFLCLLSLAFGSSRSEATPENNPAPISTIAVPDTSSQAIETPVTTVATTSDPSEATTSCTCDTTQSCDCDPSCTCDAPGIGVTLEPIKPEMARSLGIAHGTGVCVQSVEPESTAAEAGILLGDVLLSVDGETVTDVDSLDRHNADKSEGDTILLHLIRDSDTIDIPVPLGSA